MTLNITLVPQPSSEGPSQAICHSISRIALFPLSPLPLCANLPLSPENMGSGPWQVMNE